MTSEAWRPELTSFGPLTSSIPMIVEVANVEVANVELANVEVANVEVAEEQPVAQIAAVQKKEPRKKKLPWKKSGGQPPVIGGKQAASGSGSGGLTHFEKARVGSGLCYYTIGVMGPGPASVWPPSWPRGGLTPSPLGS